VLTLSFVRHASTQWNEQGRMQGRRDIPLCASGRDDLARWRLPEAFGEPAEWVSSPLCRAVETAKRLGAVAPRIEPALTEMDWGAWEGYRLTELRERFGSAFTQNEQRGLDFRPPGGESPRDVVRRVTHWLEAATQRGRPAVVVTHNGVLRALLAAATGWDMTDKPPVKLRPATLHRFALTRGATLALVECNVPLVAAVSVNRRVQPPPAPSAALP
jgi:2,3-bisphosphoglycerate-dependent phosphoglycerate mutase